MHSVGSSRSDRDRHDGGSSNIYDSSYQSRAKYDSPRQDSFSRRPNQHMGSSAFGSKRNNQNEEIILKKPVWTSSNMKSFDKQFYKESSSATRSQSEIEDFMRDHSVSFEGGRLVKPFLSFREYSWPDEIYDKIRESKFEKPTPIQAMCWPSLLSGLDMVGIARTGSGKTLGFVLPMLIHIRNNQRYLRSFTRDDLPSPMGLVLAPTRELAIQIQQVAEEFGNAIGIKNVVIYGGASRGPQLSQIRRGADIYIATPGRLLDYLRDNSCSLNKCTFLVLDEADRMLDMGFEPQIRKIIEQIRPDRQTAMFSATWPKEVRKLAEDFIRNYVHICIGANETLTANPNIKQIVELCEEGNKENRLKQILDEIMVYRDSKAIIFAETKKRVDAYSKYIRNLGYHCLTIHGDKKQSEREWVLNEFKKRPKTILCATDVAARGLNISDIKYVINVDYPMQTEDYIHRIGRTARSTNTGTAFTLMTYENARHASTLIDVLRQANQYVSDELMSLARSQSNSYNKKRFGNTRQNMNYGNNYHSNGHANSYGNGSNSYKEKQFDRSASNFGRKREATDDLQNDRNGNNGVSRVKKSRWDDGQNQNYQPSSYQNGNHTNQSPNDKSNSYYLPQLPPPPQASTIASHTPATNGSKEAKAIGLAASAIPTEYIQYYQQIAATAASNGGGWQSAVYNWQPMNNKQ